MPTPDEAHIPLSEASYTDGIRVFSQAVLERLEAGNFVPVRQHQRRQQVRGDRRSKETPLALCKRSIRYEPLVFEDRPEVILRLAKQLNRPSLKCLALYGEQGLGKTSIVRGLAELMGGGDEQLLWFELADYQQLEALCVQLLQQVVFFIANHTRTHVAWDEIDWRCQDANNRKRLLTWVEQYLSHIPNLPLLLVIDNADVLFGQTQLQQQGQPTTRATTQIISPALLHILQWWVRQPNTKLVLLSHDHLPEVLALPPQAVCHEVLRPFSPECLTAWEQTLIGTLQPQRSSNTTEALTLHHEAGIQRYLACFKQLHHASDGLPWIVQGLRSIHQQYLSTLKTALFHPEPEVSESQLSTHPLIIIHELYQQQKQTLQHPPNTLHVASHLLLQALVLYWQQVLPAEQKTLMFALLGFIQHSVPSLMLMDMLVNTSHREAIDWFRQLVSHTCIRTFISVLNEPQTLQQTFIQPLLQGGHRLEKNTLATESNEGICLQFDLPQRLKQVLAQHLTPHETYYWHQSLATWYEKQSQLAPKERRLVQSDTIQLTKLFRYHRDKSKQALERLGGDASAFNTQTMQELLPFLPQSQKRVDSPIRSKKPQTSFKAPPLHHSQPTQNEAPMMVGVHAPQSLYQPSFTPKQSSQYLEKHAVPESVTIANETAPTAEVQQRLNQAHALQVQARLPGASPTVALEYYKQAYHLYLSIQAFELASECLNTMAHLFWKYKDLERVRYCLERALLVDAKHAITPQHLLNHRDWACLLADEGYPETGLHYLQQVLPALQQEAPFLFQGALLLRLYITLAELAYDSQASPAHIEGYAQQAERLALELNDMQALEVIRQRLRQR